MYQVGDRVRERYGCDGYSNEGTVIAISSRWITVKHDIGNPRGGACSRVPPRFDYLAGDLEHMNPLLKLASALGSYDRPCS